MKYFLVVLCLFIATPAFAQEQVLIGDDFESGGFGGPAIKITQVNKENAVFVGARGGWIINHTFVLGGAGYGLVTRVNANTTDSLHKYIDLGYGGVDLEYVTLSDNLVHLSIELLIGGGGVTYRNVPEDNGEDFNDHHTINGFFILEPTLHANLNVTYFFRLAGGVSYRYVSGLNSTLATNNGLSGVSAVLTLKFGAF